MGGGGTLSGKKLSGFSRLRVELKKAILKKSAISVFVLVALWNISVSTNVTARFLEGNGPIVETLREIRDLNLHIQMRFYQAMTSVRPGHLNPGNIRLVYIDDQVHWTNHGGRIPTPRNFLATLIANASVPPNQAAVIGIDMELLAPRNYGEGEDDASRQAENDALRNAIQKAARQGVTVVLASEYYVDEQDRNIVLPNIFTLSELPSSGGAGCGLAPCPSFGYVNLPSDKREIPLVEDASKKDDPTPRRQYSFALAMAENAGNPAELQETLDLKSPHPEPVFGSFLPEESYQPILALKLASNDDATVASCKGKILLIGGHWHEVEGHGSLVDRHLSPAGYMSGLGLHANYVASLLQPQFAREVPLWLGILFDLLVGMAIFTGFEYGEGKWKGLALLIAFPVPIVGAYFALVNANRYLDFLFPIELYFLHVAYELVEPRVAGKIEKIFHSK
jgi:CHASE2 domain-containing sensor protein